MGILALRILWETQMLEIQRTSVDRGDAASLFLSQSHPQGGVQELGKSRVLQVKGLISNMGRDLGKH